MSRSSITKTLSFPLVLFLGIAVLQGCRRAETEVAETPSAAEASAVASEAEAPEAAGEDLGLTAEAVEGTPTVAEVRPAEPAAAPQPPPRTTQPRAQQPPAAQPATAPQAAEAPVPEPAPSWSEPVPEPRPAPVLVRVAAGTLMPVEITSALSSHTSQVGDTFQARLTQDVAGEKRIALPKGTLVDGRVTEASPAQKIGGRARLSLEFYSLRLPDGQRVPLRAVFAEAGKSQTAKDAAIIGGSTLGGAILGEAIDEGEGTKIGAIVGGLAGAVAAKKTKGKPVEVPAGSILTLELTQPVTVEVQP